MTITYQSGSTLPVGTNEYIGYYGAGNYNQNGGTHTVGSTLYLGYNSGSNGAYSLLGGSLSPSYEKP